MASKRKTQATRSGGDSKKNIPAWIWLLAGVLIGLAGAGIVFWKGLAPKLREDTPKPAPVTTAPAAVAPTEPAKPKYDFYNILPEMEVVVPEDEIRSSAAQPVIPPPANSPAGVQPYVLQAGSFRNESDAEALKAKLALSGLRAQVMPVTVNGVSWYRVRVGPYADLRELDSARETLKVNGISAIALRENG